MENRKFKKGRHYYSPDEISFLTQNVKGISVKELTKRFNEKFSADVSEDSISRIKCKYGLKSGVNSGHFTKGNVPFNKGIKTGFRPGNIFKIGSLPHNTKPVSSERVNKDGLLEVKVSNPNIWKLKRHFIWEKHHGTEVQKGEKIIFLDGNKRNFDIDNLAHLSNSEQIALVKNHLQSSNIDITRAGVSIAKLISKMRVLEKGNKNGSKRSKG